jgi:hypothetical protein
MKNTLRLSRILLLGALLSAGGAVIGQSPAARPDSGLVQFFSGDWKGDGAFSNGRKIAATVSFRLALDSAWLVCEHRDVPPNNYGATLYWGVDRGTGKFVAAAFDNFGGHREFASAGWIDGRLELKRQAEAPGAGTYFERFLYERTGADSFRMSYEVSRDGAKWQLGDSLVFTRVR